MNDRELLEMAAKAAGMHIDKSKRGGAGELNTGFDMSGNAVLDWHNSITWNPLTDDGDALRLAVELGIAVHHDDPNAVLAGWLRGQTVKFTTDGFGPWFWKEWLRDSGGSRASATRRAIVNAAAEIGMSMR